MIRRVRLVSFQRQALLVPGGRQVPCEELQAGGLRESVARQHCDDGPHRALRCDPVRGSRTVEARPQSYQLQVTALLC